MRLQLHLSVLVLAALAASLAQAREDATVYRLDNGLEIVVIEDHRAPVVTQMLWYRVGAADEPAGKSGVAHFLEHLMFKGTGTVPSGRFSEIVEENGGSDNAFTSADYTAYFQRVAADRLGLMMELESDRMRNLVLTEADAVTERDIILEERSGRIDTDPGAIFGEQRRAALYLNHPYGRPTIGWRAEIEALDREDALAFYRRYYAPNNAILIVAGDVVPEEVLALAEAHYGPIAANANLPPRARPQEPPQLSPRRMSYRDARVRQPYVIRTYLAPQRASGAQQEAAALSVLSDLLGGGITSFFSRELELGEKVAISTGAFYSATGVDAQSFGIYIVPAEGVSLEEAEARMDAALGRFIEEGPDADELARVKTAIRAAQIYGMDSLQGRARRYGAALASGLTVEDIAAWPEVLDAVTAGDVVAAAKRVFDARRSVTGYLVGPEARQ